MTNNLVDWSIGDHAGLVSIGSHKLYLTVCGPENNAKYPSIIVMTGVTSTVTGWKALQKALAANYRVAMYDRAGLGKSEKSPNFPSSRAIATELDALLKAANIKPPYVIIGHSWSGILGQEFLALDPSRVAGMIFVDATQARYPDLISFTDPCFTAVTNGLDWFEIIGLRNNTALTPQEYEEFLDEQKSPAHGAQSALEFQALMESFEVSGKRGFLKMKPPFLGARPVCVVKGNNLHDVRQAFDAGVKADNGTAEEQAKFREILATWDEREVELQKEYLSLTSNGLFLFAGDCGHNVHMAPAGINKIIEAVQWTMGNLVT